MMYDILSYTDKENIPGMLVLVDFYKAFDSLDWHFIEKTLDFFNFSECIKHWVKLFYTEISSCVFVNGKYTPYFPIRRGVRQGDPLSPYLFLLCAEILAQMIREKDEIKGIQIEDREALLSQFADDTALYLDGSKESFEACITILNKFASHSGLTINFSKTMVIWLGSKKNSDERFLRDMNFTWDPGGPENSKFRYLGIYLLSLLLLLLLPGTFDKAPLSCSTKRFTPKKYTYIHRNGKKIDPLNAERIARAVKCNEI